MSASGLIYVAIVGAWAAYLVPRCMRRPDEPLGLRPIDELSPSTRVLTPRVRVEPAARGGRREGRKARWSRSGGQYSLVRPRPAVGPSPVVKKRRSAGRGDSRPQEAYGRPPARSSGRSYGPSYPSTARVPRPRPAPVSRATLARRRRVLALLTLASIGGTWGHVAGALPIWGAGLPALLLLTYVAELRAQVRRRHAVSRRQRRSRALADVRRRQADLTARLENGQVGRGGTTPGSEVIEGRSSDSPADPVSDDVAAENGWEPVAVPLPTYVTAPRAPSPARRIDVGGEGRWTAAPDLAEDDTTEIPVVPSSVVVIESPAERRAVND